MSGNDERRGPGWKPAVLVGGGAIALVLLVVWLVGGPTQVPVVPPPQTSTEPPEVAPPNWDASLPPPSTTVITAFPTPSSKLLTDGGDWSMFQLEDGAYVPVPPGWDGANPIASQLPPQTGETPQWKIAKTQRILELTGERAGRVEKEIADLEKAGKKDEAAEKKVLLGRLKLQMEEMRNEIKGYEAQIDAGTWDVATTQETPGG
jgi:hypothetical protein